MWKKKKVKRGLVLGASYYNSGSSYDDSKTRAFLDHVTDPNRWTEPSWSEIESALRYIRWHERFGSIPETGADSKRSMMEIQDSISVNYSGRSGRREKRRNGRTAGVKREPIRKNRPR